MAEATSLGVAEKAVLLAMVGRFDEAHAMLDEREDVLAERGLVRSQALFGLYRSEVAALEGAHERALVAARKACERLDAVGHSSRRVLAYAMLATALHRVGRDEEARECLDRLEGSSREVISRIVWAQTQALVRKSEELAREAVADASETDMLNLHADALFALAEVMRARGADARAELEHALALYDQKGNLVMVGRAKSELTDQSVKLP